jgi:hypothetical protein
MPTKSHLALAAVLAALGPSMAAADQYVGVAVVTVAPRPDLGEYATPVAAMSAMTSWCPGPSQESPCLIKVMPGVYNLGVNPLVMAPYLDIEGSGANVTRIVGQVKVGPSAINAELRALSVENSGPNTDYAAFYCGDQALSASIKLKDVVIKGSAGAPGIFFDSNCVVDLHRAVVMATGTTGSVIGVYFNNGDPVGGLSISDSAISASGGDSSYGVYLRGHGGNGMFFSPIRIRDTSIRASGATGIDTGIINIGNMKVEYSDIDVTADSVAVQNGPYLSQSYAWITGSRFFAPTAISNASGAFTVIVGSRLEGALSGSGFKCAAVIDRSGFFPVCPP